MDTIPPFTLYDSTLKSFSAAPIDLSSLIFILVWSTKLSKQVALILLIPDFNLRSSSHQENSCSCHRPLDNSQNELFHHSSKSTFFH